jgi:DNA primase
LSRIPRHIVDQVRDGTDLVAVVSRHVRLERRGNSYVGLCPFHQERSPSFNVVPHKHMYHCFGCRAGGDVFRFLMQMDGISFIEAVKELAAPLGIEVPEREITEEERRALRARATLYDVLEEAAQLYESVLWTRPEGEPGRQYLEKRGISQETARKARLGYAPGGWSTLLDHLRQRRLPPKLAIEVGLARPRREGDGAYDAFRERVLFPIRDEKSRVIAFGGRLLEGEGPKYINSPETPLYQKSQVLYALDQARLAIQQRDRILVVEGYFDVVSLHQAGFTEAVASCGTALTPEHLDKIRRLTSNIVVLLDADEAGSRAAERALPMFLAAGLSPWRLDLPGAKDPDELVRTEGAGAMERALAQKQPLLDWFIDRKLDQRGHSAVGRQKTLEDLLPLLHQFPHGVQSAVAARLHLPESAVLEQIRVYRPPRNEPNDGLGPPPPPATDAWKATREQVHILWLLVHQYDHVADVFSRLDPSLLEPVPLRRAIARLLTGEPVAAVQAETELPELARVIQAVVAREELYTRDQAALAACELVERLGAARRERRVQELVRTIESALRAGDRAAHRAAGEEREKLISVQKDLRTHILARDVRAFLQRLDQESVGERR